MSQIKIINAYPRQEEEYTKNNKILENDKVEWLISNGKINQTMFFKGKTGDRYNIYVFIKISKNRINIFQIYDMYGYGTDHGTYIGFINKDYILCIESGAKWNRDVAGDLTKQLQRQGICPIDYKKHWKIRFCRSAYFMTTNDNKKFTPWTGMKIDLKTGLLVNKPNRKSKKSYQEALNQDRNQRKRNYAANKENKAALARYNKAGGNTKFARGHWDKEEGKWIAPKIGAGTENIDWSKIPMDDVFRHRNATFRSNIIEHYGMNAIVQSLESVVVDEDIIDGRPYKLHDVTIPDYSGVSNEETSQGLYLEMINPSTGESHFEGVPNLGTENGWGPRLTKATVKAALTWRDGDIQIMESETWRIADAGSEENYVVPIVLK